MGSNHLLLRMGLAHEAPSWWSTLHHAFSSSYLHLNIGSFWARFTHWKASNILKNPADRLMLESRRQQLERRKCDVIYSVKFFFVAVASVMLSVPQQQGTFRHRSTIIKHDTFGVTVRSRWKEVRKEGRSAIVHGLRAPLYARAKPIIHVEICLGKLGSTLKNKQPETGDLHWCFRATLMSRRLMEALPRRHIAKASLFLQHITLHSIVFNLSWQNGFLKRPTRPETWHFCSWLL